MAITRNPSVDVCLHRSLRWILLVHTAHTIDSDGMFRGNLPWGQEEKFGLGEFEQRGRELIENSLAAFPFRDGVPDSEVGSFTKLKWRELLKDHRVVSIGPLESGLWQFSPLHHIRVGVSGGSSVHDSTLWDPSSGERLFHRVLWFSFGAAELPKRRTPLRLAEPTLMPRNA